MTWGSISPSVWRHILQHFATRSSEMLCVILRSESKGGYISISNSKPSTQPQWSTTWGSCSCPKASPARRTWRRTLPLSVTSDLSDPAPLRRSTWIPTAIFSTATTICHAWTPIQAETTPKTAASPVWTAPSSGRQRGENPTTRNKEREFKKCKVKYELEIYKHTNSESVICYSNELWL